MDDAEHTFFVCAKWNPQRIEVEQCVGEALTPDNILHHMLQDEKKWNIVSVMIQKIIETKEEDRITVTYKIAHILGKRGKPFSNIVEAVSMLDPRNVDKYKQLPLSRRTITDRQHELTQNVIKLYKLHKIIQNEDVYFSIASVKSTDKTDSAQVLYFIRALTKDFQCYEELLALGTLTGRTRGADIFENFKELCNKSQLNVSNLVSACTDGAP
ncbi:protein FAM200C-like [Diorhabda sublineata]|uniref:protein FAM200C-like n=1 Tax=Diorhabda sublineata TaxID=1163346 RepID=UPI0024E08926|nr:protein FAM200C-like [Diorhabda sublineata]